jgi:hypothetical protein
MQFIKITALFSILYVMCNCVENINI